MKIRLIAMTLVLAFLLSGCAQESQFLSFWQGVLAVGTEQKDPVTTDPSAPETEPSEPEPSKTEPPATELPKPSEPTAPEKPVPDVNAEYAFVYSVQDGALLYTKGNLNTRTDPASLTKLFTCYVALQYLVMDTVVTVGEEVSWIAADSSLVWLKPGQQLTVEMLIQAMLLRSGNDAAYVLSVAAGRAIAQNAGMDARDALDVFVEKMNSCATFLGLTGSHFMNPDGYTQEGHYVTPADMLTIGLLALQNPTIRACAGLESISGNFISGESYSWRNTNYLMVSEKEYYCPAAIGLKTGFTTPAGYCLVAAFEAEEDILLVGIMKGSENESRFEDALALYEYFSA